MQADPLREIKQRVAEARVDGVFDVRVGVDERRQEHGVVVVRPRAELVGRADRDDAAVLDRDRAALDRRALDRQDPVGGKHPGHGSVRLAGSIWEARRSIRTESQIDPS